METWRRQQPQIYFVYTGMAEEYQGRRTTLSALHNFTNSLQLSLLANFFHPASLVILKKAVRMLG
jgi:hypothetical protein